MVASNGAKKAFVEPRQHGVKGVYYGGDWLDMEDCVHETACPRSQSRRSASKASSGGTGGVDGVYDVCIIGAGCLGAAVARELSRYDLSILWVEAADDVSQGATKGNSGIVHAGYDDTPGTVRSQHCWPGNQMFAQLDRELHFGYQRNGSLVLAFNDKEVEELHNLYQRGITNGVQRLRIITDRTELFQLEPHMDPKVVAALHAPDAGNVIPYEFAIALAENAVDNGVELRIRTKVTAIDQNVAQDGAGFKIHLEHWEPAEYVHALRSTQFGPMVWALLGAVATLIVAHWVLVVKMQVVTILAVVDSGYHVMSIAFLAGMAFFLKNSTDSAGLKVSRSTPLPDLVAQAGPPVGSLSSENGCTPVAVDDMLVGGSGSARVMSGVTMTTSKIHCDYVVNCAGGASDQIANMIGDTRFKIKPRLGDYILLNRSQVRCDLASDGEQTMIFGESWG
jgi:glycine/D-amino acid oxidase-like deaminating enzyme